MRRWWLPVQGKNDGSGSLELKSELVATQKSQRSLRVAAPHVCHPYGAADIWHERRPEGALYSSAAIYVCPECNKRWYGNVN